MFFFYGFVDFSQHALDFIFIGRSLIFFYCMSSNKMEFNMFYWKSCMRHGFVVFFVFSLAIGQKSYELITHAL